MKKMSCHVIAFLLSLEILFFNKAATSSNYDSSAPLSAPTHSKNKNKRHTSTGQGKEKEDIGG